MIICKISKLRTAGIPAVFLFCVPTFKYSLNGYNMEEAPFYEEKG